MFGKQTNILTNFVFFVFGFIVKVCSEMFKHVCKVCSFKFDKI